MNLLIRQDDSTYPSNVKKYLADSAPETITSIGNLDILQNNTLAIVSSKKCPGSIIIKTYDLMRKLRESDITVISGFHSPMEQECLNILLKGKQSVVICPARSIEGMRIKSEYKEPIEKGRLLFLSIFSEKEKRISTERSNKRNCFVAAIADEIVVPYAESGGKTESLCKHLIEHKKTVKTFNVDSNKNLFDLGAKAI